MAQAIDSALESGAAGKADVARPRPRVLSMSATGLSFEVELRFGAGERYCCTQLGCYLDSSSRHWWSKLRRHLAELTDRNPSPMSMRFLCVVEAGAEVLNVGTRGFSPISEPLATEYPMVHERDAR